MTPNVLVPLIISYGFFALIVAGGVLSIWRDGGGLICLGGFIGMAGFGVRACLAAMEER